MTENIADALHIRLKVFMDSTGLNNSQFADKCGIPRPSFSQIVTGKNKKVSDIMLSQIHNAFPELNILWLMFGEGNMYIEIPDNGSSVGTSYVDRHGSDSHSDKDDLYSGCSENSGVEFVNFPYENTDSFKFGQDSVAIPSKICSQDLNIQELSSILSAKISAELKDKIEKPVRKVVRITVFYDDNSYETFSPTSDLRLQE